MSDNAKRDASRRRIRTRVQAFVAACAVLLVAVPVAMDTLEQAVTPEVYAVLAAGAVAVTTIATLVTRIMSMPAVTMFIDRFMPWLATGTEEYEPRHLSDK